MTTSLTPKYNTTDYYALTIQPSDKLQYAGLAPSTRVIKFRQYFYSILQAFCMPYYFVIELSEPYGSLQQGHIGSRIHLHGIIKFKSDNQIKNFLLSHQYTILRQSRLEISKINDKKSWYKYIHKQNLISKEMSVLTNWDPEEFMKLYHK